MVVLGSVDSVKTTVEAAPVVFGLKLIGRIFFMSLFGSKDVGFQTGVHSRG